MEMDCGRSQKKKKIRFIFDKRPEVAATVASKVCHMINGCESFICHNIMQSQNVKTRGISRSKTANDRNALLPDVTKITQP